MSNQLRDATTGPPELFGIITAVFSDRGYAVVEPDEPEILKEPGSVTFSLATSWHADVLPTKGMRVQLVNVFEFRQGARAELAEPVSALAEGGN